VGRQRLRDAAGGEHVLAACKAMREQRIGAHGAVGRVEARGQLDAVGAGKFLS
jgi:hypothetical protein